MIITTNRVSHLRESLVGARHSLQRHSIYSEIATIADLRLFMESHVFAVWDFMCLLKDLQQSLTSVTVPWVPSAHAESCRFINEIVLCEESDEFRGTYLSHFELYLKAMEQAGADTRPINTLVEGLRQGQPLAGLLSARLVPAEARAFVLNTFETIDLRKPHVAAAAFTFGREDLIPAMFREIVRDLRSSFDGLGLFDYYLQRHIDVDGDTHGPMSLRMVENLCGEDDLYWREASSAAHSALSARLLLWDGIRDRIRQAR